MPIQNDGVPAFSFSVFAQFPGANTLTSRKLSSTMGPAKKSTTGRSSCLASEQARVEDLLSPTVDSHKSQPYTARVSGSSPKKNKPRISAEARLECYQEMRKWVYEDNKKTKTPGN